MQFRDTRTRLYLRPVIAALAVLGAVAACGENPDATAPRQEAPVRVEGDLVFTPSGVVFNAVEWAAKRDKSFYLVPAASAIARFEAAQRSLRSRAGQVMLSVTGQGGPSVLCHSASSWCNMIPLVVPGATVTYWSDTQWGGATLERFAPFDVIYIDHAANGAGYSGLRASRDVWGAATSGRIALTGLHFEHCFEDENPDTPITRECQVLKASVEWIYAGSGTGLLMSTQFLTPPPDEPSAMPTVAPYGGVRYVSHGNGYNLVRITDSRHPTMQGSSSQSLSNWNQTTHSLFGSIGSFTSVAEVCDIPIGEAPSADCTTATRTGTWRPNFLVNSLDRPDEVRHVIVDGNGDDIVRVPSGDLALKVPDGALEAGTVVTISKIEQDDGAPSGSGPLPGSFPQYGPFYQIEVSPSQPMVPDVVVGLCVEVEETVRVDQLHVAKAKHSDPTQLVVLERVVPDFLVCDGVSSTDAPERPARGLAEAARRFASGLGSRTLSVFTPTPAYAIHLGVGGRAEETESGYSPFGAVLINQPPTAHANGPYTGLAGTPVQFTGTGTDPELKSLTYSWNFGDGSTSVEQNPTHTYATYGTYNATLTVTDPIGATATASATVTVNLYEISGFFSPVANPDEVNRVKAGRAIPLKFSLAGDKGLDIFQAGSPGSVAYDCGGIAGSDLALAETANASGLQYDPATGQYTYVWKTDVAWANSCRRLVMTFKDGQELAALFNFTR